MALGDLVDPPVYDDSVVFIRKFKEGSTRVRFCPSVGKKLKGTAIVEVYGTEAWPSELLHYVKGVGYLPCVQPHDEVCGPCNDPDAKVRKRSRAWFMNALDEAGEMRIYTMGSTLFELLQGRESRHPSGPEGQPLSKRDYVIHHIGSGLESKYDPEAAEDGDYLIDFADLEYHDIPSVLEALAEKGRQFYSPDGESSAGVTEPAETAPIKTGGRIVPKGKGAKADAEQPAAKSNKIAPKSNKIQPKAKEEPATPTADPLGATTPPVDNPGSAVWATWGESPTIVQIQSAETPTIRLWLDAMEVEYPTRANRAVLTKLAVSHSKPVQE
jgi:hypothetical protein